MRFSVLLLASAACINNVSAQTPFKITGVSASRLSMNEVCPGAGGKGGYPTLTITHAKGAQVNLDVHLIDRISTGSTSDHRSFSVQSSPSGKTVLSPAALAQGGILPPCNRSVHSFTSNYIWVITSPEGAVEKPWGRMTSGKIQ